MMQGYLESGEGKKLVPQVDAILGFKILKNDGDAEPALECEVDLKNGDGALYYRKIEKAEATFTLSDENFAKLTTGELDP